LGLPDPPSASLPWASCAVRRPGGVCLEHRLRPHSNSRCATSHALLPLHTIRSALRRGATRAERLDGEELLQVLRAGCQSPGFDVFDHSIDDLAGGGGDAGFLAVLQDMSGEGVDL